jgi:hypothetical protein
VHRNLSNISRVKSIRLDFWDDELVKVMNGSLTAVVNTNPGSGDLTGCSGVSFQPNTNQINPSTNDH